MEIEIGNLKIIFQKFPYTSIGRKKLNSGRRYNEYNRIDKETYLREAETIFRTRSYDELQNNYDILLQSMRGKNSEDISVFNSVMNLTEKLLIYDGSEIRCKFDELLRWREISFYLGQDLLTCAFIASEDLKYGETNRRFFAWLPIIRSDDNRLHNILDKGMAENHFHLAGSTKVFELNWICLMNLIEGRIHDFKKIKSGMQRYQMDRLDLSVKNEDLYSICQKGALIRCYLFAVLKGNSYLKKKLKKMLCDLENGADINSYTAKFQDLINLCKNRYGARVKYEGILDYALEKDMIDLNDSECRLLAGERRFLYECYKAAKDRRFDTNQKNYFYQYLIIRTYFRGEMIQINRKNGFTNFAKYQDRKELFITGETAYQHELVRLALNEPLRKQNIQKLEARICPKKKASDLYKNLRIGDQIVSELENKEAKDKLVYVLHFPKIKDQKFCEGVPRNYNARKKAEKQMRSVVAFLEKGTSMNKYIRGIDTCASELDCRPEVYAQIYRYMADIVFETNLENKLEHREVNKKLCMTYHVGEDFFDIVDGLRAIDEVLLFCGLKRNSRLGHALALGIDPYKYYEYKKYKLVLSKQVLMDDLAWILVKAKETGCNIESQLKTELEQRFYYLYQNVYGDAFSDKMDVTYRDYYQSWKLRGDNPELYRLGEKEFQDCVEHQQRALIRFDRYAFNSGLKTQGEIIRSKEKLRKLYYAYHYNKSVREKGQEQEEFKVDQRYAELVYQVQNKMIAQLTRDSIAIETNPSSNYLIGTIQKYDEHPILRFNSRKLKTPEKNMSLSVSINTDDQGVFDTLLENEYALMTLALKKSKDKDNQPLYDIEDIYEWVDYVREMGLEQSFK